MKYRKSKRRLDVSGMLVEMGNALMKEGMKNKDHSITQVGTFLILNGSLLLSEDDLQLFSQLCGMFSAKKVIDRVNNEASIPKNETYEDFIKRLMDFRDNNGNENLA